MTPTDGFAPADPDLVRRLAAVTLALGEAEEARTPGGFRDAVSILLGAVTLLVDRHAELPGEELAAAARRLAAQAELLTRSTAAPWPPLVGQEVWLTEQDMAGRVVARDGAGLLFTVEPQQAGLLVLHQHLDVDAGHLRRLPRQGVHVEVVGVERAPQMGPGLAGCF